MLACVTSANSLQLRKLPQPERHRRSPLPLLRPLQERPLQVLLHELSNTLIVRSRTSVEFIAERGKGKRICLRTPEGCQPMTMLLWHAPGETHGTKAESMAYEGDSSLLSLTDKVVDFAR